MTLRRPMTNGFTIIEVMIVLAIAGLILLIVFLAVPALQRDARNTERKHDAALLVTARQEYDENSPVNFGGSPSSANCGSGSGSFGNFCDFITQGFTYYTPADINIIFNGFTVPTTIPTPDANTLDTETYLNCNDDMTGATTNGASPDSFVVLFALETSSGGINEECIAGGSTVSR